MKACTENQTFKQKTSDTLSRSGLSFVVCLLSLAADDKLSMEGQRKYFHRQNTDFYSHFNKAITPTFTLVSLSESCRLAELYYEHSYYTNYRLKL